jgi:hypothetical protein
MERIRAVGSVLVALIAVALVVAPTNGATQDIGRAVAGGSTTLPALAPSQIIMQVRRAGFEPISRPVQRGQVYVLSALDGDDIVVRLTVDARSGRLLWVADVSGTRYGGYYGYPAAPPRVRPPAPPADIQTAVRRSPPLPHTRPGGLTSAVNKESTAAAPVPPDAAAAANRPPVAPTMVPVAPLE